ncbi:unnamed protein product [Boreogadus saida]
MTGGPFFLCSNRGKPSTYGWQTDDRGNCTPSDEWRRDGAAPTTSCPPADRRYPTEKKGDRSERRAAVTNYRAHSVSQRDQQAARHEARQKINRPSAKDT